MSQMKAGAVLSYLSLLITFIIALVYTPIMIRLLGQAEYGLYALIGSVAAYFSIMDLGLGNAVIRYNSRNRAIGDKEKEAKINGLFFLLYSLISLLVVIIGIFVYYNIENIFSNSLTTLEIDKAKKMVIILIINFALSFPLSIFGSVLQAYEKFVFVKTTNIIKSLLIPLITLPFLYFGYGAVAMVIISTVVNISLLLFYSIYSFKYLRIKLSFKNIDFKILKEILFYSFFVFLGVIVDQIYWNTDQFILGIISGTIPIAVYAIAMLFIVQYMRFSTSISGLFLPKISMMVANEASNMQLTNMLIRYGRVQFFILALVLSGFILFGRTFIDFWAGNNYVNAYYIVLIIMIPLSIPLIQNIGISILYAKNLQKFRSVVLIFIAILNIVITIPLIQNFGAIGAALATAISLIIGNVIIMNFYYHFKIGLNVLLFWKNIFFLLIPVSLSLIFGVIINEALSVNTIEVLIFKILLFCSVYMVLIWKFGFNQYEKNLIRSLKNKIVKLKK